MYSIVSNADLHVRVYVAIIETNAYTLIRLTF